MSVCAEKMKQVVQIDPKCAQAISEQVLCDYSMSEGREGAGQQKRPELQKCVLACYWEQG